MKYRKLENRAAHYGSGSLREIAQDQVFINNELSDIYMSAEANASRNLYEIFRIHVFKTETIHILARERFFPWNLFVPILPFENV